MATQQKTYNAEPTLARLHNDRGLDVQYIEGPVGCLPGYTEFLTPQGWKRMDAYEASDLVAQWNTDGTTTFVKPTAYINADCDEFIRFESGHRLLMEVTPEHRMPLYKFDGEFVVKSAAEVERKPSRYTVPTTFKPTNEGLPFTDDQLRLMVAICADGCYPADNPTSTAVKDYCIVTLRKERKKVRLQMLLESCGVPYTIYEAPNRDETTYRFYFRQYAGKTYSKEWWRASRRQLAVILTECFEWDGTKTEARLAYSSRHKQDVDFIQYCAHAVGLHGWLGEDDPIKTPGREHWSKIYRVDVSRPKSPKSKVMLRGDNIKISRVSAPNGRKYCFTVPSSFFVVRHEGRIFVTGNSGKSTGCMMEILMRAFRQQPDDQGRRKSRWAIIRNTYPELKTTTIKTWQEWVPNEIAPIVYSMPINCTFKQKMADGTIVELEVYFMALDTPEDVAKLLSLELTGAYINEAREIPWEIIEGLISRIDRYPKTIKNDAGEKLYGASEPGVICDSNPPRTTHWCYTKFETGEIPRGWRKYKQPPAVYWDGDKWILNPDAENLRNLSADYYDRQLALGDEHIRVNLAGEYGMTRKGKPVFSKFTENRHVAKDILYPVRGTHVLLGIDYGLTPAVIVGQLDFRGVKLLDELPATDESLEDFLDQYVLPLIRQKYNGYKIIACGDPAGMGRSAQTKLTSFQMMHSRGITAYPAATNVFAKRKEAVDYFLGRDEGFLVSPHLTYTREALGAGYVYKETRNSSGRVLDVPDKNEFSHISDAVQYLCLYARYGAGKPVNKPVSNEVKADPKPFLWA